MDAMQATWLGIVILTIGGMYVAAWIDTRVIQPWRRRRHER